MNSVASLWMQSNCSFSTATMEKAKMKVTQSCQTLQPHGLYSPWNSPGQSTEVGSLSLLQGIIPSQGLNPGLPRCRWILYQLSHRGSPRILEWVSCPFSSESSRPRNQTGASCLAGGFFTNRAVGEALQLWREWLKFRKPRWCSC